MAGQTATVTIEASGTAVGQNDDQSITITWGDSSSTTATSSIFTFIPGKNTSNNVFTASWTVSHTYTTPATYTVQTQVYHANQVGCEGSGLAIATTTITVPVVSNYTLTASTTGLGTITSSDNEITCGLNGSTCSTSYSATSTVTFTETPDSPTSTFVGWGGDCLSAGTSNTCTLTMSATTSISAQFNLSTTTLTAAVVGNGAVSSTPGTIYCDPAANPSSTCANVFTFGDNVVFYAINNNTSSTFSNWSTGPCANETSTSCSFVVDSSNMNSTITAVFNLIPSPTQDQLNVTINGTGSGNVSSTPAGIDCSTADGTCSFNFTDGTLITLTAAPDSSTSTFDGWTGCPSATSTTCSFTLSATTTIMATFNATSTNNGGGTPTSTATTTADLSIAKTADVATTTEGGTIHYTITATDDGPATSTDAVATDTLPSGLTFVSANPSAGTSYSSSTGVWTIGDLAPSSTATLDLFATVDSGTAGHTITNTITAGESASSTDPDSLNNTASASVTIESNSGGGGGNGGTPTSTPSSTIDLAIANIANPLNPATNTVVNYFITVTNNGNASATFVDVNDTWPIGTFSFSGATTSQGSAKNVGNGISWDNLTLGPNATATLALKLTVGSNEAGQTLANIATVTSSASFVDADPSNNSSTATVNVQAAATSTNTGGGGNGGNGGGGGTTVSVASGGGGGGNGGGVVLGISTTTGSTAPQGQVLGASTTCGFYLTSYIKPMSYKNVNNSTAQVKLLQEFLNANLGTDLPVTGYYGPLSEAAVRQFQLKYSTEVLAPWVPYGLPSSKTSTGYVYKTTQRWINMIECPELALPMPQLP